MITFETFQTNQAESEAQAKQRQGQGQGSQRDVMEKQSSHPHKDCGPCSTQAPPAYKHKATRTPAQRGPLHLRGCLKTSCVEQKMRNLSSSSAHMRSTHTTSGSWQRPKSLWLEGGVRACVWRQCSTRAANWVDHLYADENCSPLVWCSVPPSLSEMVLFFPPPR